MSGVLASFRISVYRIRRLGADDEIISRDSTVAVAIINGTSTSSPIYIEHRVCQIVLEDWHALDIWPQTDLCRHIDTSTMTLMENSRTFRDLLSPGSIHFNSLLSAYYK